MATQTVVQGVPDWVRPYYERGLYGAQTLLQQGGPQQYQGPTVVPFSPQTAQGLGLQEQRALSGSPLVQTAQGATAGIAGGQLNPITSQGVAALGGAVGPNQFQSQAGQMFQGAGAINPYTSQGASTIGNAAAPNAFQTQAGQMFQGAGSLNPLTAQGAAALGSFTGGGNPYLDATFNRAAGQVGQNLDTLFARSGRDLVAQAPRRQDTLEGLAAQIYGGAYESDAARRLAAGQGLASLGQAQAGLGLNAAQGLGALGGQTANQGLQAGSQLAAIGQAQAGLGLNAAQGLGALGGQLANQGLQAGSQLAGVGQQVTGQQLAASQLAPTLAQQDYLDIAQLRDVGATVENLAGQYQQDAMRRFDFEQQRPELALNNYLQRIGQGGAPFQTQQQPVYQNRTAGALGGALAGYQMAGPWGALAGGLLGGDYF